jgi:hypothetical protein
MSYSFSAKGNSKAAAIAAVSAELDKKHPARPYPGPPQRPPRTQRRRPLP